MIGYALQRVLYALPIVLAVNVLTFSLFFVVNTPDDMARMQLGAKRENPAAVEQWKRAHGYHLPLFWNADADGAAQISDTLFFTKSVRLLMFDFGRSDSGRDISHDIAQRAWPSLMIALPVFFIGLLVNISLALCLALFRHTGLDYGTVAVCMGLMSISGLFYIIGGQYLGGYLLRLVPVSGYDPSWRGFSFLLLPISLSVLAGIGAGTRWYRALFHEEMNRDYVRAARARGLPERVVLFRHVLRNGMIPILTGVVVVIPLLFTGSLITEAFFGIPGLGSYTIDAINRQDFAILRSMVFLGSVLYIFGLLMTDLSYALVDPRVSLRD